MTWRRGSLGLALVAALGCSTSQKNNGYLSPTGNGGGTGQKMPSGTVTITINAPTDMMPDSGVMPESANSTVAVNATIDVVGGTDLVDTSSVQATLTAMGGGPVLASSPLVSAGSDTFTGSVSLGDLPGGNYTLTVTASSTGGATSQATVTLAVDSGPTVTIASPVDGQGYNGTLNVQLTANFGAAGPSASVTPNPSATIAGMAVALTGPDANNTYQATVAFAPATPPPAGVQVFPALSGPQLFEVTATDGNGVKAVAQVVFTIDVTGPSITATKPTPGQVVGGVVLISATITDESGVLDSSVEAVIGDQDTPVFTLPLQPIGGGVYGILFDTANLTPCKPPPATSLCLVFPTLSFRASDTVGNETSVGYDFSVDNVPPLADLDPPRLRQMRLGTEGYECSFLFDPLSVNEDVGDMPNDGCMVPQVFDLRARIEDQGNRADGLKVTPIATVDPDNTSVYVLGDTTEPLVVDSDGDGNCDEINPLLAPTTGPLTQSDQVLKVRLAGVPLGGNADFRPDTSILASAPCGPGSDTAPPKVLCTFEQPTVAISYSDGLPAIWSVEPIDPTFHCLGNQLDALANNIPDGQWVCIAVGTADLAGNKSVSAPIRVYVQYNDAGGFCATPPAGAGPPPTCTGTFDASANGGMGSAAIGTCQTQKFTGTEYYCAPGAC